MANIYKNAMFDLTTTSKTTVYTVPTDRTALVKSIQVTNIHTGNIEVEAFATDSSDSGAEHEVAHISLASKTVDRELMPTIISASMHLHIQNSTQALPASAKCIFSL